MAKQTKQNNAKAVEELGIVFGEEVGQTVDEKFELPNYKVILSELDPDDLYTGKPVLCEPFAFKFTDKTTGEEITKYQTRLWLMDKEDDEYLEIRINLGKEGLIQENIFPQSKLYPLLKGVIEMKYGASQLFQGENGRDKVIEKINLQTVIDLCEKFDKMTIKVVEKTVNNNPYNSFIVVQTPENEE